MSPVDLSDEQRSTIQAELDADRRWEKRLPGYAVLALAVLAVIVVLRTALQL
jgi:hypothetical protein